jgi:hypothetical protein
MGHDWLLVETLGSEPAVVARGRALAQFEPIGRVLRRSPDLSAIQTAIAETVEAGTPFSSITPKGRSVICTEPVRMTDGTVHGVHVWVGPTDAEPPERAVPGPLIWNLTTGVAIDTAQSLLNAGLDPNTDVRRSRAFADELPDRQLSPEEAQALSRAREAPPGTTYCSVWDVADRQGQRIPVGFVVRVSLETIPGSRQQHRIARAMNWRAENPGAGE